MASPNPLPGQGDQRGAQPGSFLHRMGFSIHTNPIAEPELREYVEQRQKELLEELHRVHDSMVQGRDAKI